MLKMSDIGKVYRTELVETHALRDLSLHVDEGEFDHMHGLDLYDHGARMYDAAKVAWDRVDRHGEKYTQLSPYLYCGNNSLVNVDADGKRVKTIYFKDKEDPQWYRSSKSFYLAMMQFAQTDFGAFQQQFCLAQFR